MPGKCHRDGLLIACGAFVIAGCSSAAEVEWMKVGQPYTAAEFRRDYSQCDKSGKLENACGAADGSV